MNMIIGHIDSKEIYFHGLLHENITLRILSTFALANIDIRVSDVHTKLSKC